MIYWIDAQLPPLLASWLSETFNVEAYALRDLQLRDAEDLDIFQAAKKANAVIISKDSDFVIGFAYGNTAAITLALHAAM